MPFEPLLAYCSNPVSVHLSLTLEHLHALSPLTNTLSAVPPFSRILQNLFLLANFASWVWNEIPFKIGLLGKFSVLNAVRQLFHRRYAFSDG